MCCVQKSKSQFFRNKKYFENPLRIFVKYGILSKGNHKLTITK